MEDAIQEQQDALKHRDVSKLTNLINNDVDVNTLAIPKHTDVLLTALNRKHKSLFDLVLNKGFSCKNENGFLYIHYAIRTSETYFVERLVDSYKKVSLDINEHSLGGDNCLHIATGENEINLEIIKYLTNQGISWSEQNDFGYTPLHILLCNNLVIDEELVLLLAKQKKAFLIKDHQGITPLGIIEDLSKEPLWLESNSHLMNLAKEIR